MFKISTTNKFDKDVKRAVKRGLNMQLLKITIVMLEQNGCLPEQYKSHKLKGQYADLWECHIQPDWLLIWDKNKEIELITLIRIGTHSDLFE